MDKDTDVDLFRALGLGSSSEIDEFSDNLYGESDKLGGCLEGEPAFYAGFVSGARQVCEEVSDKI